MVELKMDYRTSILDEIYIHRYACVFKQDGRLGEKFNKERLDTAIAMCDNGEIEIAHEYRDYMVFVFAGNPHKMTFS